SQGLFGDDHRQAGFLAQQLVQVTQQRAAASEDKTALGDIRGQLRRRLFQRALDRLDDGLQGFLQGFQHLVGVQGKGPRHTLGQVATAHVHFQQFATGEGHTNFLLDALGGGFTDQAAVVAPHIGDDGFVKAVAADPYRFRVDHTVERNQGDLGGTTADIDDHGAMGFLDRQAGADGRRHRLFDQVDFPGAGAQRRLANGPALNLGRLAGHTDEHARAGLNEAVLVHLVDEVLQHLLAYAEVGDDTVLHRADRLDVTGRAAEHALGFGTDSHHAFLVAVGTDGYDGRFIQYNAPVTDVDQSIGGSQVDGQITGKHAANFFEHALNRPRGHVG